MPALWQKLVEQKAETKRQIDALLVDAEQHDAGLGFKADDADSDLRTQLKTLTETVAKLDPDIDEARAAASIDLNYDPIENTAGLTDEQKAAQERANIEARDKTEREKAGDTPMPFAHFGEQLAAVAKAGQGAQVIDPRLMEIQAATGLSEAVGSEGGFLVQTDVASDLLELAHETAVLVGKTDRRPISANANGIKINAIDETSRADGSRQGGVQAFWGPEAGDYTKSKPTFRTMELTLGKLMGLYYATDEELQDIPALAANVSRWFGDEFGFKLDDALIRGTGTGMPQGILGHAGTVSVAKEDGQDATTIKKENIEAMYTRMWARSTSKSEWFINQNCWPQLFQLSQIVGVGGVPVFLPPGGLSAAPFGMLLGRPVTPIEQCDTLGQVGDIILADWDEYIMIEKGGIEAASSIHVQFLTGETAFRFTLRTDGQPKRNAPLTPYKGGSGSNTSSFITLDTRA
ncbi:MAG: phage major capsid protein [Chloroflexi bacterium]|nr:phage major capsid protein [Chloroflexota bacterium]